MERSAPFVKTLELSGTPFIAYAMIRVLENKKAARISLVICIINTLLEYWSAATGMIFYIDEAGVYHHGSYWIYTVSYLVSILLYTLYPVSFSAFNTKTADAFHFFDHLFPDLRHTDPQFSSRCSDFLSLSEPFEIMLYIYYIGLTEQMDSLTRLLDRKSYDIQCAALDKRRPFLCSTSIGSNRSTIPADIRPGKPALLMSEVHSKHCYTQEIRTLLPDRRR